MKLFSTAAAQFYIPIRKAQGFQFLHVLTNTVIFCFSLKNFLITAILMSMKRCLIVALIRISSMTNDVEYLVMYLLSICVSLMKDISFSPSPIL